RGPRRARPRRARPPPRAPGRSTGPSRGSAPRPTPRRRPGAAAPASRSAGGPASCHRSRSARRRRWRTGPGRRRAGRRRRARARGGAGLSRGQRYCVPVAHLHELTALQQAAALRRGEVSAVELVEHHLARIEAYGEAVGAFVTVTADDARTQARVADDMLRTEEDLPPLFGVPTAIK